jgi:carbon-monoxide dehydrogenase medium subunit/xanthine dehydrogenase FAD-binding subunit
MLTCDDYLMPDTLDAALDLVATHGHQCRVVAGATDTLPWAREGRAGDVHVPVIVDVGEVAEMKGYARDGDRLRLGANVTFADFLDDPVLGELLPVMPYVAVWFADDQIRAQATLAGNIVNASPAADGTPAMIALDAEVTLERKDGAGRARRTMKLTDFVRGPGQTALEAGELLTAIECDVLPGYGAAFEKVGHRRSLVISTVCVAALVKLDAATARFEDVRLGLAAVGPVPVRLAECETHLIGAPVDRASIRAAAALVDDRIQSRTRHAYRREVLANFVERAIDDALATLGVQVKETVNA